MSLNKEIAKLREAKCNAYFKEKKIETLEEYKKFLKFMIEVRIAYAQEQINEDKEELENKEVLIESGGEDTPEYREELKNSIKKEEQKIETYERDLKRVESVKKIPKDFNKKVEIVSMDKWIKT